MHCGNECLINKMLIVCMCVTECRIHSGWGSVTAVMTIAMVVVLKAVISYLVNCKMADIKCGQRLDVVLLW